MNHGGFRVNAGRPGWHLKVEAARQIDVRRWQRDGLLTPGQAVTWTWRDPETLELTSAITFAVGVDMVSLRFFSDGHPVQQIVRLDRTQCHLGGTRPWFRCPTCDRRVAQLYLRVRRFSCRKCHDLVYRSQAEDDIDRASRKLFKVEARLGPGLSRPKGMHKVTYDATIREHRMRQRERRDTVLGRCAKYLGR